MTDPSAGTGSFKQIYLRTSGPAFHVRRRVIVLLRRKLYGILIPIMRFYRLRSEEFLQEGILAGTEGSKMAYTALYRKFRPPAFDEVKGQDAIVTTLKNQLKANRIGHAYLFCGTRGTGKTTVAKILARAVNCEHPTENGPCNECETCRAILNGTSTNVIEIDAASNNGVDNIREIREEVSYRPTQGKYKIYIVDEVHMLSTGAFNALLKTLEEPPEYVIFILATTEAHKIPVTILSRCQRYDFKRISADTISERLRSLLERENVEAEEKAVRYVARQGDGSMRDALSLMDRCIAFYLGEKLTFDKVLEVLGTIDTDTFSVLIRKVISGDAAGSIQILEELVEQGKEMSRFVDDFIWYMRNLLLVQSSDDLEDVLDVSSENLLQLKEESKMIDPAVLMRFIHIFSELSGNLRYSGQKRVLVETALIRLCRPEMDVDQEALLQRVRDLEKIVEEGEFIPAGAVNGNAAGPGTTGISGKKEEKNKGEEKKEDVPVRKAAPPDLQKIAAMWQKIAGRTNVLIRSELRKARPKFNPKDSEPVLYLELSGKGAQLMFDPSEKTQWETEVRELIKEETSVDAPVSFLLREDGESRKLTSISVEEAVKNNINMDIEYE